MMEEITRSNLKNRTVYLYGEVTENMVGEATQTLHALDAHTSDPIRIFINTDGGSIYDAFGLYDVIKTLSSFVHIAAFGKLMSAGTIILQAADLRHCYPLTRFMVHGVSDATTGGTHTEIERNAREIKALVDVMIDIYSEASNNPSRRFWRNKLVNDNYFNAQEAKEIGLIDEIISYG